MLRLLMKGVELVRNCISEQGHSQQGLCRKIALLSVGKDLYDLFIVVFFVGEGAVCTDFQLSPVFFFGRVIPRTGFKRI